MASKAPYPLPHRYRQHDGHPVRLLFLLTGVLTVLGTAGMAWVVYQDLTIELPTVERLAHYITAAVTRVYADDGTLIGELSLEKRFPVLFSRIPPLEQYAFVAAECGIFYRH